MTTQSAPSTPLTGRHVLFGFLAFFGIIFAVNGVFLYKALSTHTGVVANEPYRKGLAYNERIAEERQQTALGWQEQLAFSDGADRLLLSLDDPAGRPVTGLRLTGFIGRPSTGDLDHALTMTETAPGRYEARFEKLPAGTWMVKLEGSQLTADESENVVYRLRKRLWLKP